MPFKQSVLALAFLISTCLHASAETRIAVLSEKGPLARMNPIFAAGEDRVTEALKVLLTGQTGILVIAQGEMDKITNAQDFQNSDRASSDTAARIGKVVNAEYIVLVNLENANQSVHQENSPASAKTVAVVEADVTAQVINVESGVNTVTQSSTFKRSAVANEIKTFPIYKVSGQGLPAAYNDLWTECTNSITADLAGKLKDAFKLTPATGSAASSPPSAPPAPGAVKVLGVYSGKVFLEGGSDAGIKPGDRFQITRAVPTPLKHPNGTPVMDIQQICAMTVESATNSDASGKCVGDTPQKDDNAEPAKDHSSLDGIKSAPGNAASGTISAQLLECDGGGPCNGAWTFHGKEGEATWFAQTAVHAKLTVLSSQPGDIRIRRTDLIGGKTGLYTGARKGDRISGTVVWSTPGHPGESSETWSASPPQTVCPASPNFSVADALRIGQNALMFNLQRNALDCYTVAASGGDPRAQTIVGLIYYRGQAGVVTQDYKAALPWLRQAADQGVYAAQKTLADMYTLGSGTAANEKLAKFYSDKAAEQKRDWERQQDRQNRAANNMLTGFVVGTILGASLF
jgi:TPR repeat protein